MKRILMMAAAAAVATLAQAQEVTYSLPVTTVTVEVDAVREVFFAGPYAPFAKKYLGMDVPQEDAVRVYVKEVKVAPRVEADQSVRYSVDPRTAERAKHALTHFRYLPEKGGCSGCDLAFHPAYRR